MHDYALVHLSDAVLLRDLAALVNRDRLTTAELLAHLAEVDARRLYVPAGYPSMYAYCVEELRLSEDAASKRIQAARAARRFPAIFSAVAEGRLHLTAVCLLAPHLTQGNVGELIESATHRRKAEIEAWLARRFSVPEPPAWVRAVAAAPSMLQQHAPAHVGAEASAPAGTGEYALEHADTPKPEPAPERYLVQVTISKITHDKLRHVQALLSHAVPSGDVAQVLDRALDSLIAQLEMRKFGSATPRVGPPRSSARVRHIPVQVRRAIWERDQGRCTFVSASGRCCQERKFLQFDHVKPVARGGKATVEGLRLRCRAHNQFEAERVFGSDFMKQKRDQARVAAAKRREARVAAAEARAQASLQARERMEAQERKRDVLAGLRSLGCRGEKARRAAEYSETLHGVPIEERMRAALQFLGSDRAKSSKGRPMPPPGQQSADG